MRMISRPITLPVLILVAACSLGQSASAQSGPFGVVSPSSLNFGQVLVGQTSPTQLIALKNTGDAEMTVSNIAISGNFGIPKNTCAKGVQPGTHCNVWVTFTPTGLGTQDGTLTITDNATNTPQTVSLTGIGANAAPTKTKVTASAQQIYAGQPITFTATVTSSGGGTIPDGEQVLFESEQEGSFGYGTLQGGVASITTSSLVYNDNSRPGGESFKIEAVYGGDQSFSGSTGITHIFLNRYPVTINMSSSPNPSVYCEPVTFTFSVTSAAPYQPSDEVALQGEFFFPGIVGSPATYHACPPYPGKGTGENAQYFGDAYNDWGEGGVTQVVNPTPTTTTITSSRNPSHQGKPVTIRVVVKAPYAGVVYGSVVLTSGGNTLGTVELKDSRGSITTSTLPLGENTIVGTYTPANANFLPSSGSFVQTVN